jgi:hypothetical protein
VIAGLIREAEENAGEVGENGVLGAAIVAISGPLRTVWGAAQLGTGRLIPCE